VCEPARQKLRHHRGHIGSVGSVERIWNVRKAGPYHSHCGIFGLDQQTAAEYARVISSNAVSGQSQHRRPERSRWRGSEYVVAERRGAHQSDDERRSATYAPSVRVIAQRRKRVDPGDKSFICDHQGTCSPLSTYLLSAVLLRARSPCYRYCRCAVPKSPNLVRSPVAATLTHSSIGCAANSISL